MPSPSSLVLLSSRNSATMVTWRHTSPLYHKLIYVKKHLRRPTRYTDMTGLPPARDAWSWRHVFCSSRFWPSWNPVPRQRYTKVQSIHSIIKFLFAIFEKKSGERKSYLDQEPVSRGPTKVFKTWLCLDKNHAFRYPVERTFFRALIRFVSHIEWRNLD